MGAFFFCFEPQMFHRIFNWSGDKNQRYIFITGSCSSLSVFFWFFFSPLKYRAKVCKCGICCQLIGNYSMFAHPSMAFVLSFSNIDFDIKCLRIFGRTECYGICAYFIVCNMPQLNLDQMYMYILRIDVSTISSSTGVAIESNVSVVVVFFVFCFHSKCSSVPLARLQHCTFNNGNRSHHIQLGTSHLRRQMF